MAILFFNWIGLLKESKADPFKTVSILRTFKENRILKYGLRSKLVGNSYLLNADEILNDNQTDILYIYQYLLLAARRDYSLYKLYGVKSLPLSHYPDIELSSIRHNPLLNVTNNEITFKYEG
jgi:hypothetical protein